MGTDSIYRDAKNNTYVGAISLGRDGTGKRIRRTVRGRTKAEVRRKLQALRLEVADGARTSARYTVQRCVEDWLEEGLDGRAPRTVELYRGQIQHVVDALGATPLRDLTPHDVHQLLTGLAATNSTRTLLMIRNCLERAIRLPERNGHVTRNVASLTDPVKGKAAGRRSRSLTTGEATALLEAAHESRLEAYVIVSLMTGVRTEEIRALRWADVDLDGATVAVWRSVRATGDTKTEKSRRTLRLPQAAVQALRDHKVRQVQERLQAGPRWQDTGLVFTSTVGTQLDRFNVRREFRKVCKAAGIGDGWSPRELRHTFVSVLSANGVPLEEIARLAGHSTTRTTEVVYRRELRPALTAGAEVMDRVFSA